TIRSISKVLEKKDRGDKPGIVKVKTAALNQKHEVILHYERKIMIPPGKTSATSSAAGLPFPDTGLTAVLPDFKTCPESMISQTSANTYFEDFNEGQIIVHKNMRTITDEHIPWTYRVGNTHPLHYDEIFASGLSGDMGGRPVVYGGLVFSWLAGLAGRDCTENVLWEKSYTEGYHTRPAFSRDTIGSITRILKKSDGPVQGTGTLQMQLIGVKNIKTMDAIQKFGKELFIKEIDKKKMNLEKIENKIFEIERELIIKKRPV
ncbi:MAG: acyl dehydratase, partial [Spirochaetia bacterium]|nr:acyl dehydratase [Spirochaetia bacterium]